MKLQMKTFFNTLWQNKLHFLSLVILRCYFFCILIFILCDLIGLRGGTIVMFTNILFLVLALLLINTVPEEVHPWIASESAAFAVSILLYLGLCGLIFLEYFAFKGLFRRRTNVFSIIVSLQLLFYLIVYQYILDAGRIFKMIPYMQNVQMLNVTWELFLYLMGLAILYGASYVKSYFNGKFETRAHYALRQLRLLLPFAFPFLLITLALDIFIIVQGPHPSNAAMLEWFSAAFSITLMIMLLIFLPYFIQKIWQCRPLQDGELKDRLIRLCQRANFKHAGMKTWTIMHDQLTAGIIGIVPRFRYVMFTDRLLKELPYESIEAILAHEIGHNYRKHLLLYPFILAGMIVSAGLFFYFLSSPLLNILEQVNALYPSMWWDLFNPLLIFCLYAGIIVVYFRFVFGYFSRLFERQADLHIFEVGIAPEHMIHALESVAYTCGGYDTPNWHHYSIKQRIEFLKTCMSYPRYIQNHHRKVQKALIIYFLLLMTASSLLIYLIYTS